MLHIKLACKYVYGRYIVQIHRHTYPQFTAKFSSLIELFKIMAINIEKKWFMEDSRDYPDRIETGW